MTTAGQAVATVADVMAKTSNVSAWSPDLLGPASEVSFDGCVIVPEPGLASGRSPGWRCLNHDVVAAPTGSMRYYGAGVACDLRRLRRQRAPRSECGSDYLTADDFRRLYLALSRGNLMGLGFNTFATIAWATVGVVADAAVSAAMQSLQVRLREWASRKRLGPGSKGIPLAWVWVHERGPVAGALHSHLLLSVTERRRAELGRVIYRHVERISGTALVTGLDTAEGSSDTLHITAPRNRGKGAPAFEKDVIEFQWRRLRYMAKGIDPKAFVLHRGERVPVSAWAGLEQLEPQGEIVGKRCGYSSFSLGTGVWSAWALKHGLDPQHPEARLLARGPSYDDGLMVEGYAARIKI